MMPGALGASRLAFIEASFLVLGAIFLVFRMFWSRLGSCFFAHARFVAV
jgi:hypothetical protein